MSPNFLILLADAFLDAQALTLNVRISTATRE